MRSTSIHHAIFALSLFAILQAAAVAAEPVEALRPIVSAREARPEFVEVSLTIYTLFRGIRSGMLKLHDVGDRVPQEIKKLKKNTVVLKFLRDKTISDIDRADRICRWLMKRPLKADERKAVLKLLKKDKDPVELYIDLVWAFLNSREFLYRK